MVGQEDVTEEDFVIPRAAFDSIAQEYDELLEENAGLTVGRGTDLFLILSSVSSFSPL